MANKESSLLSGDALREFARSSEGKALLRRHCDHHDVHVLSGVEGRVVQLTDLEVFEETPLGYEDCENARLFYADRSVLIRNEISSIECSVTLMDHFSEEGGLSVRFMVMDEIDQEVSKEAAMSIPSGRTKELRLRCIIPESFTGTMSRWILLKIQKTFKTNALEMERFEWVCGVFISFIVKAETKPLSIDARPFTPQHMRELFDHPVAYYSLIIPQYFAYNGISAWYSLYMTRRV